MYIHRDAGLIYLAQPRTASVATSTALKHVGFEKMEPPSDHHSRLYDEGSPATGFNQKSRWHAFTTIRNHWDIAVSWVFRKFSTRGGEPPEWNREAFEFALGPDNRWVREDEMFWLHADDADEILLYENLEPGLNSLLSRFGLPEVSIPRHNISHERGGRHYSEFYDRESRDYIADRFSGEIEYYNYFFSQQARKEAV